MNEYLTIAEFAERAQVSKQAIYKRLSKDLTQYLKQDGKKKLLSSEALALFVSTTVENKVETVENMVELVEQPVENTVETVETNKYPASAYLITQLEEKDKLINQLQITISEQLEQIKKLQEQISSQSQTFTDLLTKQSQIQENFQILLAQQKQQLSTKVETVEQPVENTRKRRFLSKWFK